MCNSVYVLGSLPLPQLLSPIPSTNGIKSRTHAQQLICKASDSFLLGLGVCGHGVEGGWEDEEEIPAVHRPLGQKQPRKEFLRAPVTLNEMTPEIMRIKGK